MVYISSVGIGMPNVTLHQADAKQLVEEIFHTQKQKVKRLLPIFDNANIETRQIATNIDWYKRPQSLETRNKLYIEQTINLSLKAIDECVHHRVLEKNIPYEAIDLIVFVSSTGMATPSIDTYLINKRPFKESIVRMPLWGLGCGGGAMGISRAIEWLQRHPTKTAIVVCAELCSLTFQQHDFRTSNMVGTALFGDGVAATLLIGEHSPYKDNLAKMKLKAESVSSFIKKGTTDIMGWHVTNTGFEVIFSKKIPRLVKTIWQQHFEQFMQQLHISVQDLHSLVAHPGGRKVLEEMEEIVEGKKALLQNSIDVLKHHGNMSSATVMYVLQKYIEANVTNTAIQANQWAILSALGPGFCSELIAMRWKNE